MIKSIIDRRGGIGQEEIGDTADRCSNIHIADRVSSEDKDAAFDLPDALKEKILSAVPFPDVCKARVLCKEWYGRFPSFIESLPRYCPAFLLGVELVGFDRVGDRWLTMNLKSLRGVWSAKHTWTSTLNGVLLCVRSTSSFELEATVVNLVTGKQRRIKCPFELLGFQDSYSMPMIIPVGATHYQILFYSVLGQPSPDEAESILWTVLYDSSSRRWSQKLFRGDSWTPGGFMVHLDGKFYHTCKDPLCSQVGVLQINYETGELRKSSCIQFGVDVVGGCSVFSCGSRIIVLVFVYCSSTDEGVGARVYQLDTKSLLLTELSRTPPSLSLDSEGIQVVSDSDSLYFCQHYHLFSYHLVSNTWRTHFPLPESYYRLVHKTPCLALEPGINIFVDP